MDIALLWVTVHATLQKEVLNLRILEQTKAAAADNARTRYTRRFADDLAQKTSYYTVTNRTDYWPGISKNDYVSYAVYFVPDCSAPIIKALTECKWKRQDGGGSKTLAALSNNPQQVSALCNDIPALAVASYLFGDPKYAQRAFFLLDKFFVDSATRMNPNLKYGQILPAATVTSGRPQGVVELTCFSSMVQFLSLFSNLTPDQRRTYQAVTAWFQSYSNWLRTTTQGQEELNADNNHGTAARLQLAIYQLFLQDRQASKDTLNQFIQGAFQGQIDATGGQPLELARAASFDYPVLNLSTLITLAVIADQVGIDMWHARTGNGTTIQTAMDYFVPYAMGQKTWKGGNGGLDFSQLTAMFQRVAGAYGDADHKYYNAIRKINKLYVKPNNWQALYTDFSYGFDNMNPPSLIDRPVFASGGSPGPVPASSVASSASPSAGTMNSSSASTPVNYAELQSAQDSQPISSTVAMVPAEHAGFQPVAGLLATATPTSATAPTTSMTSVSKPPRCMQHKSL
ncbi:hypothetical protein IWQ60_005880 [Tieghemiomyces parasiticus]|uniref:Alginate lyase domain-containing protein n=1 Tax=Tieghemiomyces parasiticus TaxID=78921 RepID=A0A9W8A5F3_9FUNG|nr:hypothetical protein IWQ60_005880 [Tieghemiomyces parasiticus]